MAAPKFLFIFYFKNVVEKLGDILINSKHIRNHIIPWYGSYKQDVDKKLTTFSNSFNYYLGRQVVIMKPRERIDCISL